MRKRVAIYCGDVREVLKALDNAAFDGSFSDPPYKLGFSQPSLGFNGRLVRPRDMGGDASGLQARRSSFWHSATPAHGTGWPARWRMQAGMCGIRCNGCEATGFPRTTT